MEKTKTIKIPIYFGNLTIIQTDDMAAAMAKHERSKTTPVEYDAICFTKTNKKGQKNYFVIFKNIGPMIIAHEVVHLVNYIFTDTGIELDRYNDEPQAYLTGWLFDQIFRTLYINFDKINQKAS